MTQPSRMSTRRPTVLPWVLSTLAMIAGTTVFWLAGGLWFDLAEANSPVGPWAWLTGGAVLLAAAGFILILFLASNVLVSRQRDSIVPLARSTG